MIALVLLLAAAFSDPRPDCHERETQAEMNACSGARADAADQEMTREWNRLSLATKRFDKSPDVGHDRRGTYFSALLAAQRAWLKFRDAECLIEGYGSRGGSIEPMVESECYEQVTKERSEQLRELQRSFAE